MDTSFVGIASEDSSVPASVDGMLRCTVTSPTSSIKSATKGTETPATDRPTTTPCARRSESRRRTKSQRLLQSEEDVVLSSHLSKKRKCPPMSPRIPELFEVETVLSERKVEGKVEVLIKWLNYDEQSWEPVNALKDCPYLLEELRSRRHSSGDRLSPPQAQVISTSGSTTEALHPVKSIARKKRAGVSRHPGAAGSHSAHSVPQQSQSPHLPVTNPIPSMTGRTVQSNQLHHSSTATSSPPQETKRRRDLLLMRTQ